MLFNRKEKTRQPFIFHDFWEMDEQQVVASYRKLQERIKQLTPQPAFNGWKPATMLVSMVLLVVCGLYGFEITRSVQPSVEIVCVSDRATQITLSDGTKVWMSAHSQLTYPQTFTGKTRDIALEGEAYFEVAHNKEKPFRVLAGGQTVVALGTGFNVRAYTDESNVKVALVEGSLSVTNDKSGQAVILKPAQEATVGSITISENTGLIAVNNVNLDMLMSWKTGVYVFDNVPFEEISKILEKGFKVTIQIENEMLKSKPYTMRFENDESLEKILDLIQVNAKYTYQYHNGIVVIK